jgi:hypothetical protein
MSANRSIQAAQRRRAGPTNAEPAIPGRGPQPSINSAQMFANQAKPGSGPNMPTGRLAGQQAAAAQKQQMQQQQQQTKAEGLSSVSKMTVPQAITLITLRLGAVESKLIHMQESGGLGNHYDVDGNENMVLIDKSVINSITSRLESLEKRAGGNSSGPETNLLKQQVETIKQSVIQTKSVLAKENKDLKTMIGNLTTELNETKELLQALQNLTMDNSQKLMSISFNEEYANFDGEVYDETIIVDDNVNDNDNDNYNDSEIIGTNLKELIEKEVNATML